MLSWINELFVIAAYNEKKKWYLNASRTSIKTRNSLKFQSEISIFFYHKI